MGLASSGSAGALCLAATVLLVLCPAAAASSFQGTLSPSDAIRIRGNTTLGPGATYTAGVVLADAALPAPTAAFSAEEAYAYVHEYRWTAPASAEPAGPSPAWSPAVSVPAGLAPSRITSMHGFDLVAGVEDLRPSATFGVASEGDKGQLRIDGECDLRPAFATLWSPPSAPPGTELRTGLRSTLDLGCDVSGVRIEGDNWIHFFGGTMRFNWRPGQDEGPQVDRVTTGHFSEPNPRNAMLVDHTVRVLRIASFSLVGHPGTAGTLQLQGDWEVRLRTPAVAAVGTFSIPASVGQVAWGKLRLDDVIPPLEPAGAFVATGRDGITLALRGESTNAEPVVRASATHPFEGAAAQALVVAVAAAGGLALLYRLVRVILPAFSRIAHDDALHHPHRQTIVDFVKANPGARVGEVASQLGIARGVARHHVEVLESKGVITAVGRRRERLLFEAPISGADLSILERYGLKALQLVALLRTSEGRPQAQLAGALGVSRSYVSRLLGRLNQAGFVSAERRGPDLVFRGTALAGDSPTARFLKRNPGDS